MGRSCQMAGVINSHGQTLINHAASITRLGKVITNLSKAITELGKKVTNGLAELNKKITVNAQNIAKQEQNLKGHKGRLDTVEPRVGHLEGTLVILEQGLSTNREQINSTLDLLYPSGQSNPCILVSFKNRIGTLENNAAATDRQVTHISNRLSEIDDLKARLAQAEAQNILNKRKMNLQDRQIKDLRVEVNDLKKCCKNLLNAFSTHPADNEEEVDTPKVLKKLKSKVRVHSKELRNLSGRVDLVMENATNQEQKIFEQLLDLRAVRNESLVTLSRSAVQNRRSSREFLKGIEENSSQNN